MPGSPPICTMNLPSVGGGAGLTEATSNAGGAAAVWLNTATAVSSASPAHTFTCIWGVLIRYITTESDSL